MLICLQSKPCVQLNLTSGGLATAFSSATVKFGFSSMMEEELGRQVRREIADAFVVLRHFLDIALARDGDAILCPLELTLEITEVLVGFQIRDNSLQWR